MKKTALIMTMILLSMTAIPVLAEEILPPDPTLTGRFTAEPQGEYIVFDAFILRPLGLFAMGVGAASAAFASPWTVSSGSEDRVNRELLQKPYWYTFCRPLGDIDF